MPPAVRRDDQAVRLLDGDPAAVDVGRPHVKLDHPFEMHGGFAPAPASDRQRVAPADERQGVELELDATARMERGDGVAALRARAQLENAGSVRILDLYREPWRGDALRGAVSDAQRERIAGGGPAV